jgi:hypothetical protein
MRVLSSTGIFTLNCTPSGWWIKIGITRIRHWHDEIQCSEGLDFRGIPLDMFIRGPFAKFVDSPYYSELELCGGAVTVSFLEVPPLASDALLTTLHPLLENVLHTVDHFEISYLGAPFSWLGKPRNRMRRDLN